MSSQIYIYVVDRDFGFAPNPFHGICTLACCKPRLRATAEKGDWVFGVGGNRLKAKGRCIYGMRITEILTFNEFWCSERFRAKKPVRNGSRVMMVGDNIYYHSADDQSWHQIDSHHSNPDGSINRSNLGHDTQTDKVLTSEHFVYFGDQAPAIPCHIFEDLGYSNGRNHRVFSEPSANSLLQWFYEISHGRINSVVGDPFELKASGARYSADADRVMQPN